MLIYMHVNLLDIKIFMLLLSSVVSYECSRDAAGGISRKRYSSRDIGQASKCISGAWEMAQQLRKLAARLRS